MRQGELLGLRWQDIDLEGGVITVRQTLQQTGARFFFQEPKTAKGRRLVEISPPVVEALRRHRLEQKKEKLFYGQEYRDQGLVFCTPKGGPIDKKTLLRWFKRVLATAGLPATRFHDLRHTCATLLLKAGTHPKVVQERLGHSSIGMTLDTYSHVLPGMQREAARKLDELLLRAPKRRDKPGV